MFKVTIPVSTKTLLLPREEQYFSILEWIASAIPATSRWYPVMQRYLIQIADRVTFMGGDPAQIPATGTGILAPTQRERRSVGKVESVLYDRFGDFEGFTLKTMDGDYRRFGGQSPGHRTTRHKSMGAPVSHLRDRRCISSAPTGVDRVLGLVNACFEST